MTFYLREAMTLDKRTSYSKDGVNDLIGLTHFDIINTDEKHNSYRMVLLSLLIVVGLIC